VLLRVRQSGVLVGHESAGLNRGCGDEACLSEVHAEKLLELLSNFLLHEAQVRLLDGYGVKGACLEASA
jgi:hypothetical protein